VRPSSGSDLVQFRTAVGAEQHSRQDRHFAHRCEPASAVADILDNFKGFLVNNGFVGIFEDYPLGRVIVDLFLDL
jgi:hypothetical protein